MFVYLHKIQSLTSGGSSKSSDTRVLAKAAFQVSGSSASSSSPAGLLGALLLSEVDQTVSGLGDGGEGPDGRVADPER